MRRRLIGKICQGLRGRGAAFHWAAVWLSGHRNRADVSPRPCLNDLNRTQLGGAEHRLTVWFLMQPSQGWLLGTSVSCFRKSQEIVILSVSLAPLHHTMQDEDRPSCPDGEELGLLKALDAGPIPLEHVGS